MNRIEQMEKIQCEALELFKKKNKDYGDAFAKYGVIGVLMRPKLNNLIKLNLEIYYHDNPM